MKKVRFESPVKSYKMLQMPDNECHFPRPFIEKQLKTTPNFAFQEHGRVLPYENDPVQTFESGNSSPYPIANKTFLSDEPKFERKWSPSNELDLSILDSSHLQWHGAPHKPQTGQDNSDRIPLRVCENNISIGRYESRNVNEIGYAIQPPNVLKKNEDFFLRRDNLTNVINKDSFRSNFNKLTLDKENNPLTKKMELMKLGLSNVKSKNACNGQSFEPNTNLNSCCKCSRMSPTCNVEQSGRRILCQNRVQFMPNLMPCQCNTGIQNFHSNCNCHTQNHETLTPHHFHNTLPITFTQNAVEKKTLAIEKYENKASDCLDVEKRETKTKREPTVSDLFKIIKLQNEQLQLLQTKVDKLISSKKDEVQSIENYVTENMSLDSVSTEQKISVGVMTSFEVVRTSTIINKEIVQKNEAQIQCNRSQISIKEVVSKSQPSNINFLEGLRPGTNSNGPRIRAENDTILLNNNGNLTKNTDMNDDKTLNEFSLYNVQVDNATTPFMSPEQSLYLDIRDYSGSDSGSDEQSNVGWTYYNKVMTHVNGMLHESDIPSSASALYRNTRQKCLQMQIDKTNISVAKRVTFGDDPLGVQQHQVNVASSDTSFKMNQLAAKYLKSRPTISNNPSPKPANLPVDMSIATKNYMERHKLLKGTQLPYQQPASEIPRFLDITALKQQPKFL